jgi:AraC-like DNA-binding protein
MPQSPRLLPETPFYNPRLSRVGLEVMSLAELRAKVSGRGIEAHRVEFFMVLLITEGTGEHVIDFETIRVSAGKAVVVRPGEVQQWRARKGLEGELILVDPRITQPTSTALGNASVRLLQLDDWPSSFTLSTSDQADWVGLTAILRRELDRRVIDDLSIALAHELFLCLMLRLARTAQEQRGPESAQSLLYRQLLRKLERSVATRPSVEDLARQLRVSSSTLTRACQGNVGRSAKEVIDRRVALEAQRLLVHSGATGSAIGEQLGFSEPTNFVKFFKRQVGMTPEAFRRLHQSDEARSPLVQHTSRQWPERGNLRRSDIPRD